MKLEREVIVDLLPAYFSGEASAATLFGDLFAGALRHEGEITQAAEDHRRDSAEQQGPDLEAGNVVRASIAREHGDRAEDHADAAAESPDPHEQRSHE